MSELVRFDLESGGAVFVEMDEDEPGIERAARVDDMVVQAGASLEQALEHVRSAADVTLVKLRKLAKEPTEVEVEFGVRLNATVGAVIAKSDAEGHLRVRLTWKNT